MSSDVTTALVRALIENLKATSEDWASLALVLEFDDEMVHAVHGFAYSAEGKAFGATASPHDIRPAVEA